MGGNGFLKIPALSIGLAASLSLSPIETRAEESCHDLVESFIESDNAPVLMDTTAYIHGTICSHGDKARKGIAAIAPEWYGSAVIVYEAVPDGKDYKTGDWLCILEGLDTGYGKSTGDGIPSKVRPEKDSRGTIEAGKTIDVYCESMEEATEWMELTGGKVMVQIIRGVKG